METEVFSAMAISCRLRVQKFVRTLLHKAPAIGALLMVLDGNPAGAPGLPFLLPKLAASTSTSAPPLTDLPPVLSPLPVPRGVSAKAVLAFVEDPRMPGMLHPLVEQGASSEISPASLTKLVTAMVVLDRNPRLEGYVQLTEADKKNYSGEMMLDGSSAGEWLSIRDALRGTLIGSRCDLARALARSVAGSEAAFVPLMNQSIKGLRPEHTRFATADGRDPWRVDGKGKAPKELPQYTTPRDMIKILRLADQYGQLKDIGLETEGRVSVFSRDPRTVPIPLNHPDLLGNSSEAREARRAYQERQAFARSVRIRTTNHALDTDRGPRIWKVPGAGLGKTGTTDAIKSFVVSAVHGGMKYFFGIFGSNGNRFENTSRLARSVYQAVEERKAAEQIVARLINDNTKGVCVENVTPPWVRQSCSAADARLETMPHSGHSIAHHKHHSRRRGR